MKIKNLKFQKLETIMFQNQYSQTFKNEKKLKNYLTNEITDDIFKEINFKIK